MLMQMVAVRDIQAEAYMRPFFVGAVGLAIRSFQDEVNRKAEDNPMHNHAEDFVLFHFGTFDDSTGAFNLLDNPEQLASGKMVKGVS